MKKFFLVVITLLPTLLSAQNGVTISNFSVSAAGSVTLDISWKADGMPTLWLDSAWVFVDYNDGGVMKRLPLNTGATLTATSAPGVGKVIAIPGNTQGVWVVGKTRGTLSSFSATVVLPFNAATDVKGACAYAPNYPPLGKWNNEVTELTLTGTPPYCLLIESSLGTAIEQSGSPYTPLPGTTLLAFTDVTGAPGMLLCTPPTAPTNLEPSTLSVCSGTPITLTVSGGSDGSKSQFEWGTGSVGENILGTSSVTTYLVMPTTTPATTFWVRRVSMDGCGVTTAATVSVAVTAIPTVLSSTGGTRCATGTVSISATASANSTIDWYATATDGAVLANGTATTNFTTPSIATSTTYYAQARHSTAGCVSVARTPVLATINDLPAVLSSTGGAKCSSGTVSISATASANATIDWYATATDGAVLANGTGTPNFTTPSIATSTTYYAQARNSTTGCVSATRTPVLATIANLPTIESVASGSRCGEGTVILTATPSNGAVIDWYPAITGGTSVTTSNTYTTPSINTTTTYYVEARIGSCVSAGRTAAVATVLALPTTTSLTASTTTICNGSAATLTAAGTSAASYSFDNGSTWQTTTTKNVTPTANTTYTLKVRSSAGCTSSDSKTATITVNAVPAAPTAASTNSRCGSGTVTFSATPAAACTIDWYTATSGGSTVSSGTTSYSPSLTATTTYYAQSRNTTTGCISATRLAVTATVNAVPAAPTVASANARCGSGTVTFSATPAAACTIDWYTATSGGSTVSSGTTSYSPSLTATTTYYAQSRNTTTGCISATRLAVTAMVSALPATPVITTANVCIGTNVVFKVTSPVTGGTYTWTGTAGTASGTGGATYTVSGATAGAKTATVNVKTTANGVTCTSANATTSSATVSALPAAPTAASTNSRCGSGAVTFSATPATSSTIDWYNASSGGSTVSSGTASYSPSLTATTTYYAQSRNTTTGCISATRLAVTATVNAVPAAPTVASTNARCGSGTVTFSATPAAACTIDWYTATSGGSTVSSGTASYSPSLTATTTYYAQSRNTTTTCVSASRLSVTATVTTPATSGQPPTACGCAAGLSNCGPTCESQCVGEGYAGCSDITYVSSQGDANNLMAATALCTALGAGWRLPVEEEATCLCEYWPKSKDMRTARWAQNNGTQLGSRCINKTNDTCYYSTCVGAINDKPYVYCVK